LEPSDHSLEIDGDSAGIESGQFACFPSDLLPRNRLRERSSALLGIVRGIQTGYSCYRVFGGCCAAVLVASLSDRLNGRFGQVVDLSANDCGLAASRSAGLSRTYHPT